MEESQHPPVVVDSMTIVAPSPHHLPLECSVKWTATQERSINHEFPFIDLHLETPEDYVSRIYLQHLWLPESLMPLRFLVLSLLRVTSDPQPSAQTPAPHCLIHLLHPLLLTPRACSQKYQTHVSQVLADDSSGSSDVEESMMWYALKFEKMDDDQGRHAKGDHHVLDGKWKNDWLERMERREVLIQILLHFLLLSLPGVPTPNQTDSPPASPRKRKRHQRDDVLPSTAVLEEQLEFLMDKLSMWQLMSSLDEPGRPGAPLPNSKGKQKAVDERDWMQVFCEDLVERLFRDKLPELCRLLRSKVFQDSPFSDASDDPDKSPPPSPRQKAKRLKQPAAPDDNGPGNARSRSRSLSMSLEQERERSRSVSIGPGNARKRTLDREISMSTGFKGKEKTKSKSQLPPARSKAPSAGPSEKERPGLANLRKNSSKGVILVTATPTKTDGRISKQPDTAILDSLKAAAPTFGGSYATAIDSSPLTPIVEGDDRDDEWTLPSSPDVLLLGSQGKDWDQEVREARRLLSGRGGHVLVTGTPTKPRRK